MKNNKAKKIWYIGVIIFVLISLAYAGITYRAGYLQTLEIGEEYLSAFEQKNEYVIKLFTFSFIVIFMLVFITTNLIKRGLKDFFDDEKKEMPKLLNKSLALVIAIISSFIITSAFLEKFILFTNATWFGNTDPIFGLDIGFYFFQKPFVTLVLRYIVTVFIALAIYTAIYYIAVFNIYLNGVDKELLTKSRFVKLLKIDTVIIIIGLASITFLNSYDIVFDEFITLKDALSTKIRGAGIANITIKLWGYRILSVVMIASVILILKNILNKEKTKQLLMSILIVPGYLVSLFAIIILFNVMFVNNNKLDKEKEYIGYNIEYTKAAYNLKIDEEEYENTENITNKELNDNSDIIKNIKLVDEDTILKTLNSLQTNSGYYSYKTAQVQKYEINGEDTLVYVSPREIKTVADVSTYNNKTYEYTHGFGAIITYANNVSENGNVEYVQKSFNTNDNIIYVEEPRIYFGLETNDAIITNLNKKTEFDYPVTSTVSADYAYSGQAGIKANFWDRLILSITNKNVNVTFSDKDSKIVLNRNIIKRAEKIMPNLLYDKNPYLIISDNGRLIWVLDAYTVSNEYPYAQKTLINVGNSTREINYIRNSVKVLVDAYDGTVDFYLMDETDPIAVAYSNVYPDLFKNKEEIGSEISSHFVYPEYLYNVQAEMLKLYHNVTEDVLYRGDDIWDNATFWSSYKTTINTEIEPYYTMIKDDNGSNKVGLILPYTSYKKQNITSYLVGTVNDNNELTLKIYKYASGSNVLGPAQLDKEIEQDETISSSIQAINVTGTKVIKNIVIVPIENSLLYIEPIYQQQLNEKNAIPLLKKVVVAFENKIAIGDTLQEALENLVSQSAVKIKVESTDTIDGLIESIIEANKNLTDSSASQDFEMIGKDITKLQNLITQLEEQREVETKKEEEIAKQNDTSSNKIIETTSISREFNN